ncbi:FabD/lysophospholipase-like protein [Wilcoxina mikolae CBS 423.85]|nr:FabD/lysophospholipase-like protein [Wilcoxina mikolae CBS 423.85]
MSDHINPLMVLSLNGGGIRGYGSLCIFEKLETKIKEQLDARNLGHLYSDHFKPCEYFNLIGGASTGAIIALMLGRLGLTIGECKGAYSELSKLVFGDKWPMVCCRTLATLLFRRDIDPGPYRYSTEALEKAIDDYLVKHNWGLEEDLVPSADRPTRCIVLIPVVRVEGQPGTGGQEPTDTIQMLSTHPEGDDMGHGWTIKQAIMAATAAPLYFPTYTHAPSGRAYIDAAFRRHNNPCLLVYERMKKLNHHRKEALFLDVGTGTHDRTLHLSDFWGNVRTTFGALCSQHTETALPSTIVEGYCNRGYSEKTYYRLDVEYPRKGGSIKPHHHRKLKKIEECVNTQYHNQPLLLDEVARRIVDVMSGDYHRKGSHSQRQKRLHDPCNKAAGSSAGVCFCNDEDDNFFRRSVPATWMPYTSHHMPDEFEKFERASKIIERGYSEGQRFDTSQLESVKNDLYHVLNEQRQALRVVRESRTLLSEFTLTAVNEKKDVIKDLIALMEGRQVHYPNFMSPCEWFSIQRQRDRDREIQEQDRPDM